MPNIIDKSFTPKTKEVKYLNKDFDSLKSSLVEFSKTYFPNTYKDFSSESPGMMFIELCSYVGDVLSYYIDSQFKESLMAYAEERKNLITLARFLGYKVKVTTPSITELELYHLVPSLEKNGEYSPDLRYALNIKDGMEVKGTTETTFRTLFPIDFSVNSETNPTEISVYQRDAAGNPQLFLLKKNVKASSGQIITRTFSVNEPQEFYRIDLPEDNVIEILSVIDADNNRWYEVEYLAQELVFEDVLNNEIFENTFSKYRDTVPYILKTLRTSRRFISGIYSSNQTYLEFGAGTDSSADELIIPNINTVGRGISEQSRENVSYDPSNFLKTKTYGAAPKNTTLTIQYVIGGGIGSNINTGEINSISQIEYLNNIDDFSDEEKQLINTIRNSLSVTNSSPAVGGKGPETEEEIRQNGLGNFFAQNRIVTKEDYLTRIYGMSQKFGGIAKAYILQDQSIDNDNILYKENNNQFAINVYVLSFDKNKKLTEVNEAILYNLKNYIQKYRMLTDSINIFQGFIVNIGVEFEIISYKNFNKQEVLTECIKKIQEYFDIDKWSFNDFININNLQLEIAKVEGVQSVTKLKIFNLTSENGEYSSNYYNIESATENNIVYPSLDPCIFELKYPNSDIIGRSL